MGRMHQGCLGAGSKFKCDKCGLEVSLNLENKPKDYTPICAVCISMIKAPTEKLSDEELNRRKIEIKKRLNDGE